MEAKQVGQAKGKRGTRLRPDLFTSGSQAEAKVAQVSSLEVKGLKSAVSG